MQVISFNKWPYLFALPFSTIISRTFQIGVVAIALIIETDMQKYSTSYRNATFGCYKGKHSEEGNWCQYCCQWEWEASFASVYSHLRTSPQPIRGKLLTGQRDLLTTKAMVSLFQKYCTVMHGTKPAKLIKITILKIRAPSSKLHRNSSIMKNLSSSFDVCQHV